MSGTRVIAHRGGVADLPGVAENSLEAFEGAIGLGADMVEFDVRRTRDGALIVFHDAVVRGRPVGSLERAEIAAATGREPALLAEVLELTVGRIGLDVELKEPGYVGEVMRLVGRLTPADLVVTSFLDEVVADVAMIAPDVRAGLLLAARPGEASPVRRARACRADFVAPHWSLVPLGVVGRAARAGLPSMVWTVNPDRLLTAMLANPDIEGVITDRPSAALRLARA